MFSAFISAWLKTTYMVYTPSPSIDSRRNPNCTLVYWSEVTVGSRFRVPAWVQLVLPWQLASARSASAVVKSLWTKYLDKEQFNSACKRTILQFVWDGVQGTYIAQRITLTFETMKMSTIGTLFEKSSDNKHNKIRSVMDEHGWGELKLRLYR